jgi:hypothetical protein
MGSRPTPFSLNLQQQLPSSYSTRAKIHKIFHNLEIPPHLALNHIPNRIISILLV